MKHEWRKKEKQSYIPNAVPEIIDVPTFQFALLSGAGNPNGAFFSECITALYTISYAIKMNLKKLPNKPDGYMDWTVYPLEGVWDINEKAREEFTGTINKDDLVFDIMIRQPDFVSLAYFQEMIAFAKKKKPHHLLEQIDLKKTTDGKCIQMLHVGSYDDEPRTFAVMETYAEEQKLKRKSKVHREIYLSDFRKVAPEKLKTSLRFQVIE